MKTTSSTNKRSLVTVGLMAALIVAAGAPSAYAALDYGSKISQEITAGVISTDIRDSAGVAVVNPIFAMGAVIVSNTQQTATGTLGNDTNRITVDNPGGAPNGWTLSLNATTPGAGRWVSGSNNYQYSGTTAQGQLTVNPTAGTITPVIGTATGVTRGASASFTGSNPITIMTASNAADKIWQGYITGIGLSQTIPASQPAGSYVIDMTQTVTAS